ncbi:MAG TPA: GNAT family N-acetyltransferase [Paraburkholderia sp.]|uniref:GNAT family N-acetyltransferase n=1 Tax=Paraburkholderia sp. TaxID=1926495 RepID=UPI002C3BCFB2|nr:GNAT family N-acetyltransferase [Paraburkholderia sp.]HTR06924.1 GNAT family N-acetyltransferase [Paraburkholderia sp.]
MSNARAPQRLDERIACIQPGIGRLVLRRFDARHDSWEALTRLLNRAFARLAALGLHCLCADQSANITRERALAGDCFVAVCNGRIVGTLTVKGRDSHSQCEHYRQRGVASVHQFGIEPKWQSRGIGRALLAFAGHWAAARGYTQIALDTPFPADHLIAFYRAQGFSLVDVVRFAGRGYDSAVLSKAAALHGGGGFPHAPGALPHALGASPFL